MLLKNQEQTQKLRKRTFLAKCGHEVNLMEVVIIKIQLGSFLLVLRKVNFHAMMPSVGEFVKRSNKLLSVKLSTFHRICEGISKIYTGTIF